MPLVQVDLPQPVFAEKGARISDEIHQAFIDALAIPADDKFQIFRPREVGELIFDPGYGGVDRRSLIVIQVLMVHMYPVERKRELYRHIVTRLSALGIRREDIQIAVTENGYEDWYAGRLHGE
jgi:phenylpyruvate tautomerase PptA (4-oxalocrotonate tautomerase family)